MSRRNGHSTAGCAAILLMLSASAWARPTSHPVALLEDNAEQLFAQMTDPHGQTGEGYAERRIVFSGASSARIVPMQRHDPHLPGWQFRITRDPDPGEYRYIRFAWRTTNCQGIMIQLHDETDWNLRYFAGANPFGWAAKSVSDRVPAQWMVLTKDLYKDFGLRTITGMALTVFPSQEMGQRVPMAGYFDHIYLARSIDDLDRIDATGVTDVRLAPGDAQRLWTDLTSDDAPEAYRSFWTLVAAGEQALPLLKQELAASDFDVTTIRKWIEELDAEDWSVRTKASQRLTDHIEAAAALLESALRADPSPEARTRIEQMLRGCQKSAARPDPLGKAIRILEYMRDPRGKQCLEDLAKGPAGSHVAQSAKAALARVAERRPD